jgi:hypothetical protein
VAQVIDQGIDLVEAFGIHRSLGLKVGRIGSKSLRQALDCSRGTGRARVAVGGWLVLRLRWRQ